MTLTLPWPPSTNKYWRPMGSRLVLTKAAREYRAAALRDVTEQGGPRAPKNARLAVLVTLHPPDHRRRDVDNFGGKAVLDALTFAGVFEDDSLVDDLRVTRGAVRAPGAVEVTVSVLP